MPDVLLVFAKAPEPGTVKTRLTSLITDEEAAQLYEAFLGDSLAAYATLAADVWLYLPPSSGQIPDGLVPGGIPLKSQRGDGLGQRMLGAFVEAFLAGYGRAVVIGTDHPTLPLAFVEQAFRELAAPFTTVLGPSDDGGYYLLGMNELYPQLFQGMAYSHDGVFADTLQRAQASPASVSILPSWYDVDTPDDLRRLADDLDADADAPEARRTREVMAVLRERYDLTT